MDYKLSILVITYNHEKYLKKALRSIYMQRFKYNYEIVICDDCSTDKTVEVAELYRNVFGNKMKIFKNERNIGITKNYQNAFSKCTGDFIAVLEGDDYWIDPLKIQTQMDFLLTHPSYSMVFGKIMAILPDNRVLPVQDKPEDIYYRVFSTADIVRDNPIQNFSGCMYNGSVMRSIDPSLYNLTVYDWMINIVVSMYGPVGYIPRAMTMHPMLSSGAWSGYSELERLQFVFGLIESYDSYLNHRFANEFLHRRALIYYRMNEILSGKH